MVSPVLEIVDAVEDSDADREASASEITSEKGAIDRALLVFSTCWGLEDGNEFGGLSARDIFVPRHCAEI